MYRDISKPSLSLSFPLTNRVIVVPDPPRAAPKSKRKKSECSRAWRIFNSAYLIPLLTRPQSLHFCHVQYCLRVLKAYQILHKDGRGIPSRRARVPARHRTIIPCRLPAQSRFDAAFPLGGMKRESTRKNRLLFLSKRRGGRGDSGRSQKHGLHIWVRSKVISNHPFLALQN